MDAYTTNLLGALAVGFADVQDAALSALGLAPAELATVLAVHARPGSKIDDIARTTGLTHSGAVRVVDRLGGKGIVERRAGRDQRTVALHCTEAGSETARRALALRRRALREAAGDLAADEQAALRSLARKLLARLPTERPHAWRICRLCDHAACRGSSCPVGSAVP